MHRPLSRPLASSVARAVGEGGVAGFSIAALFASSQQGAVYDWSDAATTFQDSPGLTAGVAGQPVGLVLDERLGPVPGVDLVTNGSFDSNITGWTTGVDPAQVVATWDTGRMKLTRGAGGSAGGPTQSIPTVAGTWYKLTFTATAGAGGAGVAFRVDSGILGSLVAGVGTKTAYFLATGASASPYFWNINTNAVDYIDSVTVAAMPGNHATQSTTAAKPTLQAGYVALDRFDDFLASTTGGGGTTGILLCAGIRAGGAGAARTIWSDRGASTGYRLSVNASNQLVLSAGNGSAHTDCVGPTITAGTDYVVMGWHDGTNLNVRVGLAAATAQAFATAAAGTAGFTVGRDNGAATGYYGDRVYALAYRKNDTSTSAQRDGLTRWVAQKANITL